MSGSVIPKVLRGGGYLTPRGGAPSQYDAPGEQHVTMAKVGGGESDLWGRVEGRKGFIEYTLQTGASGDVGEAEVSPCWLGELNLGDVILLGFVNGDPSNAYVIGRVDVVDDGFPDSVAGVSTGAELAADVNVAVPPVVPLPLFTWHTTRAGRMWALETGAGGDIMIESGAGMQLRSPGGIHVAGAMHVGFSMATPPVAALAGVEDVGEGELPGVPGTPAPPNLIENPTTPPYVGDQDAVVRAKDAYQSNTAVDGTFWAWLAKLGVYQAALDVYLTAVATLNPVTIAAAKLVFDLVPKPGVAPTSITSNAMSASAILRAGDSVI